MTEELARAMSLVESFGEIFCLTFIRDVEPAEALRRIGAYPDTFAELRPREMEQRQLSFTAGYPRLAGAVALGGWTVVVEPGGFEGAVTLLAAVSRGTEAVSVLRHDYADAQVGYALDGRMLTGLDPTWPDRVWGTEPGHLDAYLNTAGLKPTDPAGDGYGYREAVARGMVLAELITGITPQVEVLTGPMLSAEFDPWFVPAARRGSILREEPGSPDPARTALVEAIAAAGPAAKRAAAVAEVRRIAGLLGVADVPGLAEVLAAAEAGQTSPVAVDSPLGRHVRAWLKASATTSWSLNDHSVWPQTESERARGNLFGWLALVLRAALDPDPDLAVRTALYPLGSGLSLVADSAAHPTALSHLRS